MYGAGSGLVALYPLCSPLAAAQIGEQIEEDEMREMLAEADRSGTGRVGAHVEKAPPWRSRASGRGSPTHTRKHAPPLRRPSQHVAVADGVAHFTPFNIQVGPDDFVHIVTSYAHHYDG